MARIRSVKPEFWTHPIMGRASDSVKCMALALLNLADDEGYFLADPFLIRSSCRPFDESSGTGTVLLRELSNLGWIEVKNHPEIGPVGRVVNFKSHQSINKPKLSNLKKYFVSGSDTVSVPDGDGSATTGNGMERNGKEEACMRASETEIQLRECIAGRLDFIRTHFPHVNIELETEEIVAKFKSKTIGADPWLVVSRWLKQLPAPPAPEPAQPIMTPEHREMMKRATERMYGTA